MTQRHQLLGLVYLHEHTNVLSIFKSIHLGIAYIEKPKYSEGQFSLCFAFLTIEWASTCFTFKFFHFLPHHVVKAFLIRPSECVHITGQVRVFLDCCLESQRVSKIECMGIIISGSMRMCFVNHF